MMPLLLFDAIRLLTWVKEFATLVVGNTTSQMTLEQLPKLKKQTLVDDFITRFEEMILSGKLGIGEKLPSERDLASQLGVSRPVVHEGLIDLANKGLITRGSSGGAVVNDYRKDGSLPMLTSLLNYRNIMLDPAIATSTLEFRLLVEVENSRLASRNRSEEQLEGMKGIIRQEELVNSSDIDQISELDFRLHHLIALATGNIFYALLLNSFKTLYMNFVKQFYAIPGVAGDVLAFHRDLVSAIEMRDEENAVNIMTRMLEHGGKYMTELISRRK